MGAQSSLFALGRFISRIEDYMKYKPVEVLIFENQQFRLDSFELSCQSCLTVCDDFPDFAGFCSSSRNLGNGT